MTRRVVVATTWLGVAVGVGCGGGAATGPGGTLAPGDDPDAPGSGNAGPTGDSVEVGQGGGEVTPATEDVEVPPAP
ncbi:MAG: hypothetical protein AAGN82_06290 [Myxococcota bacterium]